MSRCRNKLNTTIDGASLVNYTSILDVTKDPYYIYTNSLQNSTCKMFCTPNSNFSIPYGIDNLHEVRYVSLSHCSDKAVKFVLSHIPNIERLTLYKCDIKTLNNLPSTLESLSISNCKKLQSLDLCSYTSLTSLKISDCYGMINDEINYNIFPDSLHELILDGISINGNKLIFPQSGQLLNISIKYIYFTKFNNLPSSGLIELALYNTGIVVLDSKLPSSIQKLTICSNVLLNTINTECLPLYVNTLELINNNICNIDTTNINHPITIIINQDMPIYKKNIRQNDNHNICEINSNRMHSYPLVSKTGVITYHTIYNISDTSDI